ncbi:MAG: glycosyltransferase family 39 protein [Bryobacterales bacterium]|nr:glycosyltransferase family 39 protein [Bryobacteraceae bacterium]MDW8128948.1 glycosyltransferase family 39 protein [Bryobacterales bacterium]
MPQAFYILYGALLTVAVSLVLGQLLLRALGLRFPRQEQPLFAFAAGAACLSQLVFVAATVGVARKGVFQTAGLLLVALALWRGWFALPALCLPALPVFWKRVGLALALPFVVLYFFNAMAPEMSPDGSTYHLGLVARYLRRHGFEPITTNMYANLSQGIEMLYLFAFSIGRHSAAALLHFACLVALPLSMIAYARRFGFAPAGVVAALFTFLSPVVGQDGTTAYIDVATAWLMFTVFHLAQIWDRERNPRILPLIGLLAGFCYAAKYTAVAAGVYALAFLGWRLRRQPRALPRTLATVALCAAIPVIPWVAKNWIWLGNPFSPFFNRLFPNPYIHVSFEQEYAHHMRNYVGLKSHWEIPLEVTVRGAVLCGLLGPLFLLSPIALLSLRDPNGRRLLAAAFLFGLPYAANIGTRFLIPALPLLSLAMAMVFARLRALAVALALAHAILSWPDAVSLYSDPNAWRLVKIPLRQALRLESEESWLTRKNPYYPIARMIEDSTPPGARVLSFNQVPEAYTTREILVVYQSAFNAVLGDILWHAIIPEYPPQRQLTFRFDPQELGAVRLVQTNRGGPDHFSVGELRLFLGERELPRRPLWRLRARPKPWDVQMAFDNSPATRWRSWQTLEPGMFVEVELPRAERLDRVVVECSRDQYRTRLRLEGRPPSGQWRVLDDQPQEAELPPPIGLRRAAASELKRRGVHYVLIWDQDFGAEDFRKNAVLWGATFLGERNGARLYRLD